MTTGDMIDLFFIDYDDMHEQENVMEDLQGLRAELRIRRYEIYKTDGGFHLHVYLAEKVQFNRVFFACCSTKCCGQFLKLVRNRKAFGIRVSSSIHKSEPKCIVVQDLTVKPTIESHKNDDDGDDDNGEAGNDIRESSGRRRPDCTSC